MIDVKQAIRIAKEHFVDLLGNQGNLLLEEVEAVRQNGSRLWKITLSTPTPIDQLGPMTPLFNPKYRKDYRVFTIDAQTGEMLSMKIRSIDE